MFLSTVMRSFCRGDGALFRGLPAVKERIFGLRAGHPFAGLSLLLASSTGFSWIVTRVRCRASAPAMSFSDEARRVSFALMACRDWKRASYGAVSLFAARAGVVRTTGVALLAVIQSLQIVLPILEAPVEQTPAGASMPFARRFRLCIAAQMTKTLALTGLTSHGLSPCGRSANAT